MLLYCVVVVVADQADGGLPVNHAVLLAMFILNIRLQNNILKVQKEFVNPCVGVRVQRKEGKKKETEGTRTKKRGWLVQHFY